MVRVFLLILKQLNDKKSKKKYVKYCVFQKYVVPLQRQF